MAAGRGFFTGFSPAGQRFLTENRDLPMNPTPAPDENPPAVRLLHEPLVHFLLLGAVLFGLFAWRGSAGAPVAVTDQIVITPGLLDNMRTSFQRMNGRAPDAGDLDQAVDLYVREEVLDREARALGLDRDDTIVRRRLAQRMEFISTAKVEARAPSEEDLRAFFEKNPALFKREDGGAPQFAEAREAVERAWLNHERQAAADAAYEKMRARYTVVRQDEEGPPGK